MYKTTDHRQIYVLNTYIVHNFSTISNLKLEPKNFKNLFLVYIIDVFIHKSRNTCHLRVICKAAVTRVDGMTS